MKDQKKTGSNPEGNKQKPAGNYNNTPGTNKSAELKTKGEDVWKDPDPTTPERKNDPDPTKPEKQEGPFSKDTEKKNPSGKKNPAAPELNGDQDDDIGSLEEQDIDDQGITGEADGDDDIEENDRTSHKKSA